MTRELAYIKSKADILEDKSICEENRKLFKEFFEFQENRLKRIRGLRKLDEGNYNTLYCFVQKFRNINKWFNNKAWKDLTEQDIKKVYDDLEDGKILNNKGKPFECLSQSYYDRVFKSKAFEMVGKDDIARKVIQSGDKPKEVRFITEEDFRKIVEYVPTKLYRLLFWLQWDIGENINSLLRLKKLDFYKQNNPHTKEPEYRVNLRKEILKRSRRARSEINNYIETTKLLDDILPNLQENDLIFNFGYGNSKKIMVRAVEKADVKCIPNGERPSWKDLRSGMACDLLKKGYSTDEVNARLGHKPSSDEIDKYINFLAIDRHVPKKKVSDYTINNLKEELEQVKERERLQNLRNDNLQTQMESIQKQVKYLIKGTDLNKK